MTSVLILEIRLHMENIMALIANFFSMLDVSLSSICRSKILIESYNMR